MAVPLRQGVPNFAKLEPRELPGEIPSVCVMLSQDPASDARWRLRLMVQTEGNHAELGQMVTAAPSAGASPSRVVLEATCPGAIGWAVIAEHFDGTPGGSELLDIAASRCCGDSGVQPLEGFSIGSALATRAFGTYAPGDDVAGVLSVPAGEEVIGIAAFAAAGTATATVQIAGDTPVPVPDGGALELDPPLDPRTHAGTLRGPVAITFTDCEGFAVEVLR
ncbi:MAG: hypothetical protein HYZ29_23365 [Myxococcales bacterium]|nr:hypothetical protein [Myxococcales bacterium]